MSGLDNRAAEIEALKGTKKYTWGGVINFLQDQLHTLNEHETEWIIEKQELQSKIAALEGELRAQERINRDLLKRLKMFEYALRQERIKYGKSALNEENEGEQMGESKVEDTEVKLAKRKAQRHRDMLKK
jgi:striatin 1/3/4